MRPECERGSRSVHDAQAWICACEHLNEPKECLIFDIPKFKCQCGLKFEGDFDFCLADVRVNGNILVEQVLQQNGEECMATSICHKLHLMHVVESAVKGQYTDRRKMNLKPENLINRYNALFPTRHLVPPQDAGVHKFVNMSLILRDEGIPLQEGGVYKIGDVSSIPGDNFEAICEELAEGNPLLTNFHPGPNFFRMEYCQVYKAPLLTRVFNELANGETVDSHMIVLIGAFSKGGVRGFYFLNSYGTSFCPRIVTEHPVAVDYTAVVGGIGKIFEKSIIWNAIKFHPEGETAEDRDGVMRLGEEADPNDVSLHNRELCSDYIAMKLLEIEEIEVAALAHQEQLLAQEALLAQQEQEQLLAQQQEQEQLLAQQQEQEQLLAQQEQEQLLAQQQEQEQLLAQQQQQQQLALQEEHDWNVYLT